MRYDKLVWKEGEVFEGMPFVHDDTREDARGGDDCRVTINILDCNKNKVATFDGKFEWKIEGVGRVFYVECNVTDGERCDTNTYMFFVTDENNPTPTVRR